MITRDELSNAKHLWQSAHDSATLAHECWRLLIESRKALIESYRQAGFPFTEATREFEKLMEDHAERYQNALTQMDEMGKAYAELLEQFKKASD